jgi:5-methylcytosine-specific restriction endonuclease McrA
MQGQGRKHINPFYKSSQWRKLRHAFINGFSTHLVGSSRHINRLCIRCWVDEGRVVAAHTIDHIKPINQENAYQTMNGKYGEPLDWENLQPLCEHHNAIKTGKERNK